MMQHDLTQLDEVVPHGVGDTAGGRAIDVNASDRRRFLQLLGSSLALAGHGGCKLIQPTETIVPYVRAPEHLIPGRPLYYATAVTLGGYATGVLVESHLGRPTKIEGNPEHPASRGGTDAQTQAAILSLYDPERSQVILRDSQVQTWEAFRREMSAALTQQQASGGGGLRILTETVTSPTLAAQLEQLLDGYPQAKWHSYEPIHRDASFAGTSLAFGELLQPRYDLTRAEVIVSLDANFLADGPGHVAYARDFAGRRDPAAAMSQLHVIESNYTITGSMADYRLPLRPSRIAAAARFLAEQLLGEAASGQSTSNPLSPEDKAWLNRAAMALQSHSSNSLVIAGEHQPAVVHALSAAINAQLNNVGATVEYVSPVVAHAGAQIDSLHELVDDMQADDVKLLVILGGNPVYNTPADVDFAGALKKVATSVHHSPYEDETSAVCRWHIPAAHELESWSDARAFDGTATILQPLIAPLYDGKTPYDVLAVLSPESHAASHDIVRNHWRENYDGDDFEMFWRRALHDGIVPQSRFEAVDVAVSDIGELLEKVDARLGEAESDGANDAERVEVLIQPDPTIYDGRFANNAWLQELPKPITTLTWDNAAHISPATARRFDVRDEQLIELQVGRRKITIPVLAVPGHADDCVTVHLGYGRAAGGNLASGTGHDVYNLQTSAAPWIVTDVSLRPLSKRYALARTQSHHRMEQRDLVRTATLDDVRDSSRVATEHGGHSAGDEELTIFESPPPANEDEYAWGMSINLSTCIGCSACVVACQAENNIPVVGKQQVLRGREMHWIRVDEYIEETPRGPQALHQPVACMHCENAPCEVVCPVAATVHSDEGLNEMVYNRCVGTRYCSNNCPYKVRRFNFLQYVDDESPVLKLLRNPDVTVRMRGVMEKCTYCVQRINAARIEAKKNNRRIADGDVVTACQQACPTQAIVFGDTADANTKVSQAKAQSHDYGLLAELNTRPRTTYLARVTNHADESEKQ